MIPLIPTVALAFVSFICSAFVILRIVIPILPPHPLSRRVPPSEFGLPNFRSLSPADKSHIWLASFDILALAIFVWEVATEYAGGPAGYSATSDPASAVRVWLAVTLRQSCLLVVAGLTLLHVRMGRSVAFGTKHWMLWAPTLLLVVTSTVMAGVLAGVGVSTFFVGLVAYSTALAIFSSVAFACLIGTLIMIRRNLAALNEIRDPWPPAQQMDQPRPSFATEDIDALKDGSSWITSRASSRRESISAFSFSTHHSVMPSNASARMMHPALASHPSIPAKSSFWFNSATPHAGRESSVPPVPPLPAPYRPSSPTSAEVSDDPDPFRRDEPRPRMGSQTSWLTEPSVYQPTLSAWSFPATRPGTPHASVTDLRADLLPSAGFSRPVTPAMTSADVLGGYGYAPEAIRAEKGVGALASVPASDLDVSIYRAIAWLVTIWVPLALALPYYFMVSPAGPMPPVAPLLLMLSVTLSSPMLALNILFRSPLPIPSGLFDTPADPPSVVMRAPSALSNYSHDYKRSGSVTVVEGRRSGDVWLSNGDATGGKGKVGRAMGLLHPVPKLSVLPPDEDEKAQGPLLTPPLPIQRPESTSVPPTPASETSAEMGRRRKESKASSYYSGTDDSVAMASRILIAQRHYSALATTMVIPASPERRASADIAVTGFEAAITEAGRSTHLRARSVSSISGPPTLLSPPPSVPLPPTPPAIKNRKAARLTHRKSYSSGFSFGAVDNMNEIDALSAGVLPLLVPGLKVGEGMKITDTWKVSPASSLSKGNAKQKRRSAVPMEMGGISGDFSSPELHSTPAVHKAHTTRAKKSSAHKRHHFSLPSLSLGKDGVHALASWRNDLNRALEDKLEDDANVAIDQENRRNTIYGGELIPNPSHLNVVEEEDELLRPASPVTQMRSPYPAHAFLPVADVPEGINTARNSLATLITALDQELRMPPPSAASEITLFDFNNDAVFEPPLAESTPHESQRTHTKYSGQQQAPPPVPELPQSKTSRRSSIIYIKSDENAAPIAATTTTTATTRQSTTTPSRLAEWSSRAVRPLMPKPKTPKVQPKASKASSPTGLRPLSLLQDRDTNALARVETRPLTLGKKGKSKGAAHAQAVVDENAAPEAVTATSGLKKSLSLKPLKLARSETTKARAILRQEEVLPNVVVRPPSQTQPPAGAWGFEFR